MQIDSEGKKHQVCGVNLDARFPSVSTRVSSRPTMFHVSCALFTQRESGNILLKPAPIKVASGFLAYQYFLERKLKVSTLVSSVNRKNQ